MIASKALKIQSGEPFAKARTRSRYAAIVATLLLGSTAPATTAVAQGAAYQPAEWAKIVAAARTEGRVVVYGTAATTTMARIKPDFEKANPGIVLEYSRLTSPGNAVVVKFDQEREANVSDGGDLAITNQTGWIDDRGRAGLFKPPVGPSSRSWPPEHLFRGTAVALALEPLLLVYNTNQVKTPMTGYQDLLRPELKGRFSVPDPANAFAVAWWDWLEKGQGADFMARLATQNVKVFAGGAVTNVQSAASGETAATAYTLMSFVQSLLEGGAPIKAVIPNPSFGVITAGAVVGWTKRPNTALVFIDYLTSVRGQTVWHGTGASASPLPGIPGAMEARNMQFQYDLSPYTAAVVRTYLENFNKKFRSQ